MKARPILFSAPMIRALLDGQKTQTRMVVKPQPHDINHRTSKEVNAAWQEGFIPVQCPFGKKGDFLWLREDWQVWGDYDRLRISEIPTGCDVLYCADRLEALWNSRKRQSRFMPCWASRLTLEITNVRVERLQDINQMDAYAEGIDTEGDAYLAAEHGLLGGACGRAASIHAYADLWESHHGPGSWDQNPWVWVIEFTVHHCNVDELIKQREAA